MFKKQEVMISFKLPLTNTRMKVLVSGWRVKDGRGMFVFIYLFFISYKWIKIRLHTESQNPWLPAWLSVKVVD
jgi:hypothetical protein